MARMRPSGRRAVNTTRTYPLLGNVTGCCGSTAPIRFPKPCTFDQTFYVLEVTNL